MKGCPEDCGLCAAHLQIAGTAAIEISNKCNGACPTCLANNRDTFELSVNDIEEAVNTVLKNQDFIDVFTLSGGEPTIHPELFEIIHVLQRPEIGRIVINTNGIRISNDDDFLERLSKEKNIYVCLHYDGSKSKQLRGVDPSIQEKAIERLAAKGINMVPLILAAKDINDSELGQIIEKLLVNYPTVKSVMLSMMTYTGKRGTNFPGDPLTRLTIPAALDCIAQETNGKINKYDFMPLPMPNPMCAAIGYFLIMDGEITPLIPLGDVEQIIEHTKNGNFGALTDEFEQFIKETINNIYADPDEFKDSEKLLRKFKTLLKLLFPADQKIDKLKRTKIAEKHIRTVYLMQFMDSWTFDSKRFSKWSCQHILPGGKITASCGYYSYHRKFDDRFA